MPASRQDILEEVGSVVIVGGGRLGTALSVAIRAAGWSVQGPFGRTDVIPATRVAILCVPDASITTVAKQFSSETILAHCSGALTLAPLAPHEAFSFHPLLTVTQATTSFTGVSCAVAANGELARRICERLVRDLGMRPLIVSDEMRGLYHAAATAASGYLVTVASLAESLMARAGVGREHLLPLAQAAIANWGRAGSAALTGPIVRGDEETVTDQRRAIAEHSPDALPLWDALTEATRSLVQQSAQLPARSE